tara:strand:+ start:1061 stop:3160 length:2100 start_codon:yes stop_codon:yes gene_type:complete
MQKLQLYLGTNRLELFGDETVSITQTIQNVKDISKVFTDFSKTFSVPSSPQNSILFKHYYNFDIVGGFDALNKVEGKIELNSLPFKEGYIRLEGVDLRKNKPYAYRITFFGKTVNLKDQISEDMLSDLDDLDQYNLDYNTATVKAKLQNDSYTEMICAPLITHSKRLFYDSDNSSHLNDSGNLYYHTGSSHDHGVLWSDLKYAIKIKAIIVAIQVKYGIVFSSDFFYDTNPAYYNLSLWLHRKSGGVDPVVQVTEYVSQVGTFPINQQTYTGMVSNSILSVYTPQSTDPDENAGILKVTTSVSAKYAVRVFYNSTEFFQSPFATTNGTRTIPDSAFPSAFLPGSYTVSIVQSDATPITITSVEWEMSGVILTNNLPSGQWAESYSTNSSFNTNATTEFIITQQIPEMKVIDFLTGIFSVFNLTAYSNDGVNIVVQTLDRFYDSGYVPNEIETYNIDKYLEISKSTVDVALPYKQVNFEYEGLGTFLAKQYEQLNNLGWGTLRYTLSNAIYDAPTEVYTVKPPFEHMQMERLNDQDTQLLTTIQYGYFVNENQQPYFGKPLLFYPIPYRSGTQLSFRDTESSHSPLIDYNIPSNSVGYADPNIGFSGYNINFGAEINEFALTSEGFSARSLFLREYTDYVSAVFNTKRRITKVKAFLPLRILISLKLNDRIRVRNQTYIINSVTTNLQSGESDFELLNEV